MTTAQMSVLSTANLNMTMLLGNSTTRYIDWYGLPKHPHWMKFDIDGIDYIYHQILGIYIAIVCGVAILGNLVVIWMFTKERSLRTSSNMFIINLAIFDLGSAAVNGFPLLTISSFQKRWYFGYLACQLYAFFGGICGIGAINTLAAIALDRYLVIAKPFWTLQHATKKRSLIHIILIWTWAVTVCLPPMIAWGKYIPEGFHTSCSFDYLSTDTLNASFVWFLFSSGFCIPLCIIIFCYTGIVFAVAEQKKMMSKTAEKMGAKDKEKDIKQEIKLAKVAAGSVAVFLVAWLPYATVALLGITGYSYLISPWVTEVPVMMAKSEGIYNPFIYALSHPRFQAALVKTFPCCAGFCRAIQSTPKSKAEQSSTIDHKTKGKGRLNKQGSEYDSEVSGVESESHVNSYAMSTLPSGREQNANVVNLPDPNQKRPERPPAPAARQVPAAPSQHQAPRVAPAGSAARGTYPPSQASYAERLPPTADAEGFMAIAGPALKQMVEAFMRAKKGELEFDDEDYRPRHGARKRRPVYGYENRAYSDGIPPAYPPYGHPGVYAIPMPVSPMMIPAVQPQLVLPNQVVQVPSQPAQSTVPPATAGVQLNQTQPSVTTVPVNQTHPTTNVQEQQVQQFVTLLSPVQSAPSHITEQQVTASTADASSTNTTTDKPSVNETEEPSTETKVLAPCDDSGIQPAQELPPPPPLEAEETSDQCNDDNSQARATQQEKVSDTGLV